MSQIKIGLRPILGDEDLPVLEGRHGSRVHIEVRVNLLEGNLEVSALKQATNGGGSNPLSDRTYHAAGDEDELGHSLRQSYPNPPPPSIPSVPSNLRDFLLQLLKVMQDKLTPSLP